MTQILITPTLGTARAILGKVMTGGHHYLLVDKTEVSVRNLLTQDLAVAVEGIQVDVPLSARSVDELVKELAVSREKEKDESYEDYRANLYRFAIESLTKETETGGVEEDAEAIAAEKAAAAKAKADAAAEKAAAKAAAAAKKVEEEAAAKNTDENQTGK